MKSEFSQNSTFSVSHGFLHLHLASFSPECFAGGLERENCLRNVVYGLALETHGVAKLVTFAAECHITNCQTKLELWGVTVFFSSTGLLKIVMLSGCVFFKGLFLCCHSSKMPKGIFSLKNHLWAKPKCGVMDPERTFWVVTSGWKQALRMGIGFFPFASNLPIVNSLLPSLNSASLLPVPGRVEWVSLFC